jgi:hypothetical protein
VSFSPVALKRFHAVATIAWGLMLPVSLVTGWVHVVVFVSVISIYANFVGHFSSWQASRAEQVADPREENP